MERKTFSDSEYRMRRRGRVLWLASALLASLLACVGESDRGSARAPAGREGEAVQQPRQPAGSSLEWDTIPALEYQLFDASIVRFRFGCGSGRSL
jgi:hypothetical protein